MKYKLVKQVMDNDALRNSFIDLAIKTFDLSFKDWYKKGLLDRVIHSLRFR
ncbi:Uncharacterised protein [Raoultella terrigena]|uniref:Uncharacterized protein n=1 Tax=Raoultella terrigena TaxID=577 RepID=A0A3P8L167_RAOTE|nr:Uncharacterised protein [Raoultella terrigena]